MTRENALEKIKKGGGQMPPYAGVLTDDQLEAILSYVHSVGSNQRDLQKLKAKAHNRLRDMYMNTTGYVTWKDPSGNPAIKATVGNTSCTESFNRRI